MALQRFRPRSAGVDMPYKRDPLKKLTEDERLEIELLLYEIRDAYKDLGGKVCECGKILTLCKYCCPSPA